jgi:hypothetical protein
MQVMDLYGKILGVIYEGPVMCTLNVYFNDGKIVRWISGSGRCFGLDLSEAWVASVAIDHSNGFLTFLLLTVTQNLSKIGLILNGVSY